MSKVSRKQKKTDLSSLDPRVKFIVLPIMALVTVGAIVFVVMTIANLPQPEGSQRGVGADGFRAYEEKNGNLGVGEVASRDVVVEALGEKAKSVKDVSISNVFNINGTRGQTATFDITKANGKPGSIYIDIMVFKNQLALDEANIYSATGKTDPIKGHPAYYMHAQTISSDREYRLMVVDGIKVYKFVLTQPFRDITINEVMALATLKKIVAKSNI